MAYGAPICAACGGLDSVDEHHLVPRVEGGQEKPTVWLCRKCHGATHGVEWGNRHQVLTVVGLAKAKAVREAMGVRLGNPRPKAASDKGNAVLAARAAQFAANIMPTIRDIQAGGVTGYSAIATALRVRGIPTAAGGDWQATTVRNIMLRVVAPD